MPNLPSYNFAPSANNYSPVFGGAPGTVAPAPSIYSQVGNVVPSLPSLTGAASGVIQGQLAGNLSPQTINNIKDQSAAWGISSGMPGSGLSGNLGLRTLGQTTEQVQGQGVNAYLNFLSGLGGTQTNPAVTQDLAMWNATNKAAPNPAAAEQYMQSLLQPASRTTLLNSPTMTDYFTPAGSDAKLPLNAAYA